MFALLAGCRVASSLVGAPAEGPAAPHHPGLAPLAAAPAPAFAAPRVSAEIAAPPVGLRDLACAVAVDDAGAEVTFDWTVDGADAGFATDTIPAAALVPGQAWRCRATARGAGGEGSAVSDPFVVPEPLGGNVLLVVIDDFGTDKAPRYGMHPDVPAMPRLDALMGEGVWFRTAYATPACSTSRAAILTGRQGRRTGFLSSLREDLDEVPYALDPAEVTIPELLREFVPETRSAALGKWHLASNALFDPCAVTVHGFDTFEGTTGNVSSYYAWTARSSTRRARQRDGWIPSAEVDDALAAIAAQPEPWFDYVAFHAAHTPLEVPPADLPHRFVDESSSDADKQAAILEAFDAELGRLLDGIDPAVLARTTVIVVGDNGTTHDVVLPPLDPHRAKLTVYEGGVRVPLVITGPAVANPGRVSDALVHVVDLFPTIADLAGAPLEGRAGGTLRHLDGAATALDGRSLLPVLADLGDDVHDVLVAEREGENGVGPDATTESTVRDLDWKLVRRADGDELYRLGAGLDEGDDLLRHRLDADAEAAWARLDAAFARFVRVTVP